MKHKSHGHHEHHSKHAHPGHHAHHSHHPVHHAHKDAAHHRGHHHHSGGPMPIAKGESESEGRPWGHGEYANMPQEVVFQHVGPSPHFMEENINDTMRRLDEDAAQSIRGERKGYDRGMY